MLVTRNDVKRAVAAGIAVAWVNRTGKHASRFSRPDYEVSSLDEVIEILERPASREAAR